MEVKEDWITFTPTCTPADGERVLVKFREKIDDLTNLTIMYWQQKFLEDSNMEFIKWKRF